MPLSARRSSQRRTLRKVPFAGKTRGWRPGFQHRFPRRLLDAIGTLAGLPVPYGSRARLFRYRRAAATDVTKTARFNETLSLGECMHLISTAIVCLFLGQPLAAGFVPTAQV